MAQEPEYIRHDVTSLGTMNADANIASLGKNEFSEARNYRQSVPGEYEIRTNYKAYNILDYGTVGANFEVICAAEYKYTDVNGLSTIFDVTIYQDATNIKAIGINRGIVTIGGSVWSAQYTRRVLQSTGPADLVIQAAAPTVASNPPVQGYCLQYGSDLIVTLYGYGVFAIYPTDVNGDANIWVARSLGKDSAKKPDHVTFADTQKGDLFLVLYDDNKVNPPAPGAIQHHTTPQKLDPGAEVESIFPPLKYLRVPLNATYYNSATQFGTDPNGTSLRYWEAAKDDPSISANDSRSKFHLQARAWGYRFVFVHKYTDSRGNHITYRSAPSEDVWVPNEVYCPAQMFLNDGQRIHGRVPAFISTAATPPTYTGGGPRFVFSDAYTSWGTGAGTTSSDVGIPFPNAAALRSLGEAIIAYNGQSWAYGAVADNVPTGMDERIWLGAMYEVGFWRKYNVDEWLFFEGDYKMPYFAEVTANDLVNAPCSKFLWSDFHAGSDVTEIEIYRTAHVDSTSTVTLGGVSQPLYQPHLMGYVGSLKAPAASEAVTFIDNIPDDQIDFSSLASDYEGQLAGDFSGKVLGEYGRQLVLGDISSSYRVGNPWTNYQIFVYPDKDTSLNVNPVADLSGGITGFLIQYIDVDGNVSAGAQIGALGGGADIGIFPGYTNWGHVIAVMPAGYDPAITGVRLIYTTGSGANFFLVKTVKPDDGFVAATAAECNAATSIPNANATADIVSKEAGVIIWSDPSDAFSWKGLNYLKVHQSAPVTGIIAPLIGELVVTTDRSTALTNLNGRFEEESPDIGCIGRFASVKTDKVIFFLTQNGMYFEESSGPVSFPGFMQKLIKKYANERIAGVEDLKNLRRASLGWLAKQRELHLYLPGSHDLGGALSPSYIVYKFFENTTAEEHKQGGVGMYWARNSSVIVNYEFTLLSTGNLAYPAGAYAANIQSLYQPLIFTEHSDGKLYACYKDKTAVKINTTDVDNTTDGDFAGDAYLEFALGLDSPLIAKILRNIKIYGDFVCSGDITHGAPRLDGVPAYTTGMVYQPGTVYPFGSINLKVNEPINHRVPTSDVGQSTSYSPVIRLHTAPDVSGNHKVRVSALTVFLKDLHNHPS